MRRTRINKAFVRKHLYTEIEEDGQRDWKAELELSELESAVEPIISKIVFSAEKGAVPSLTAHERRVWDFFFVVQFRRVPDLNLTVATDEQARAVLRQTLVEARQRYPHLAAQIDEMESPDHMSRTVRNARIRGVAEVSARVMNALGTRGLAILRIGPPCGSFLIGSRPVVQMNFGEGITIMDEPSEMWLPISSGILVGIGLKTVQETLYTISNPAGVVHFNNAVVAQSTAYASHSRALTSAYVTKV